MDLIPKNSKYNEQIANEILDLYGSGKNLFNIEGRKGFPSRRTINRWRAKYPEFGTEYDLALICNTDAMIEECIHIAETEENPKKAKNMIDIRTWIASRINRQRWGDRLEISQTVVVDITPTLAAAVARMKAIADSSKVLDVPCEEVK